MVAHELTTSSGPGRLLFENASFLAIDKDHVHVRTIVQLLPAKFAQANDREFDKLPVVAGILMPRLAKAFDERLAAKLENRVQANIGDIGNLTNDLSRLSQAPQVPGGNAQHFSLLKKAQLGE